MIEATATRDVTGPSTRYENEYTPPPRMPLRSRIWAISTMRLDRNRMRIEVNAQKKIDWAPTKQVREDEYQDQIDEDDEHAHGLTRPAPLGRRLPAGGRGVAEGGFRTR